MLIVDISNSEKALQAAAQNKGWVREGVLQRTEVRPESPDCNQWSKRTVIVATNAAETEVTFEKLHACSGYMFSECHQS